MDFDLKKRLVSVEQLHTLLDFMREHPELARGTSRGRRGKLMTVKVWNACAKKLNCMKDGADKDGKGWSKYWCDWKYRVRRHALELRVARDTNKTPPEGITPLSPIEETIMSIIGDSSIDSVMVKSDPLIDQDANDGEVKETNDNGIDRCQFDECKTRAVKRRRVGHRVSARADTDDDDYKPATPPQRVRVKHAEESDSEEDSSTTQFLRLEKKQLENAKKIQQSVSQMSLEICKLTEIMGEIRDVLVKRLNNDT